MTYAIFDLDGTIANISHRRHYVQSKPKNWPAFEAAIPFDRLNVPVAAMMVMTQKMGLDVIIASGRSETSKDATIAWLKRHEIEYDRLIMRADKDYRNDTIVKKEFLDRLVEIYGGLPEFAVDDRTSVVDMWRANGVFTFDVNQTREVF